MVTHSECEISQSWRTQFSSHSAFNLNHADMPPPSPYIYIIIPSCSNAATTHGLGHSTHWRRTEQRVSSTVTIQSTLSSTVSVTRIHTRGAASTQTTVSSITKSDQSTPVASTCHRSWVGFLGTILQRDIPKLACICFL